MNKKNWLAAGTLALAASVAGSAAQAQTSTVPGEQVGLATGAPLPEGVYAINTFFYQGRDKPQAVNAAVNIPVLVWATPWVPLGGRIELAVAPPTVFVFGKQGGPAGIRDLSFNVGTFVGGLWAFDIGGNIGVSVLAGAYLNDLNGDRGVLVNNAGAFVGAPVLPQLSSNAYRLGGAVSYTGDGWNVTANLTYNFYDTPGTFENSNSLFFRGPFNVSDALNLELTATKKFDLFNEGRPKFEIGAIGYGSINLDPNKTVFAGAAFDPILNPLIGRQGRFHVGGLIGYDFGRFSVQAFAARTVARTSDWFDSTEGWFRVIVPLWAPPPPAPAPIVRKY